MNFSSPLRIRAEKDVIIRIYRQLRGKGEINVAAGQEVTPEDIIGSANVSAGFRTINVANLLSVEPSSVSKYLKRSLGQKIYKDELLAYKSNFLGGNKIVISPVDGILDFLNTKTGDLRITFLPKKEDLPAGVYGIVERVEHERGLVMIKTQSSIIHGMLGSGKIRDGILHIISRRDEMVGASFISPKYAGQILVGGSIFFKEAISSAISSTVNGLITGGINAKDYKGMAGGRLVFPKKLENDIGISIVVCEGFGSISIGEDIYNLLLKYDGKFVSINGNAGIINLPSFESKSIVAIRKTNLPPLTENMSLLDEHPTTLEQLKPGLMIRVIGSSYVGEQGRIIRIDQTETVLPSGIKTFLVTVETKRRKIKVPVANLEIISEA